MMRSLILPLLVLTAKGCPTQLVWQSGPQTVDWGSSVKLNCTFSPTLHLHKPSLTWIKVDRNSVETRIYPGDSARYHVDSEAFKKSMDAGILLSDLRREDSGRYLCSITILQGGVPEECRGGGTYLTMRGVASGFASKIRKTEPRSLFY